MKYGNGETDMAERVTIQDIADALGLSRNTVSKAINNTGLLADTTREKILKKAIDMKYKQFSYITTSDLSIKNPEPNPVPAPTSMPMEIALFSIGCIGNSHFSSSMLDDFQRELSQLGYSFTVHRIDQEDVKALRLPAHYNKEKTAGIICVEMFDRKYSDMLCSLRTPILFVDSPVIGMGDTLLADCLYMENKSNIHSFVQEMVSRGKKKIGFIGEYLHCQSFFERYMGCREALSLLGLPFLEEYCITGNQNSGISGKLYQQYLVNRIESMDSLPDVFICANDFVALDLLQAFKILGITVPKDVWLCGFDDSPESKVTTPSLTTIHIHSRIMGFSAVYLLMSRIKDSTLNYRIMHTETSLIYRESTGDQSERRMI